MKNLKVLKWFLLSVVFISLSGCMKDEFLDSKSDLLVVIDKSNLAGEYTLSNVKIVLQESNSNETSELSVSAPFESVSSTIAYGTYTATLEGDITMAAAAGDKTIKVKAVKQGIVVDGPEVNFTLELFASDPSANFVFEEIFFTGTLTPEGEKYNGDKYFILHNNSMDTLYADGLFIAQSDFLTITKREYTPNVMAEAVTSDQIFMVPGEGQDHPVLPGESFIIANNAINHKEYNTSSLDLSAADLEIELIGSINVDNPAVPNAINVSGNLLMHNQGYTAYVMGRFAPGEDAEAFKNENAYTYSYETQLGTTKSFDTYKIPNSYIIDAVNISVQTGYAWNVTAATLDSGWSFVGKQKSDAERFGKSIIRKKAGNLENGKPLLQDTDNSTDDFTPGAAASLIK